MTSAGHYNRAVCSHELNRLIATGSLGGSLVQHGCQGDGGYEVGIRANGAEFNAWKGNTGFIRRRIHSNVHSSVQRTAPLREPSVPWESLPEFESVHAVLIRKLLLRYVGPETDTGVERRG